MIVEDPSLRSRFLQHARQALEAHLAGESSLQTSDWPIDLLRCGVFVTLRTAGTLRGCIGTFESADDLPALIARMAVAAANDPRFVGQRLSQRELPDLSIELSLLTPLERINDPLDFELGRHGIYVKHGSHVGCFLPSVASEQGWSKETLLTQCCSHKAGLTETAWREPAAEIYRFEVDKIAD